VCIFELEAAHRSLNTGLQILSNVFCVPCFAFNKNKYLAMEVASPLTFDHTVAGTKRQFPCSPFDTTNRSQFAGIESSDEFVQQRSFKRRRFSVDESMEGDSENTVNQSPFLSHSAHQKPFLSASNGECRSHCRWFLNLFLVNFSFDVMSYRCRIHN
jgi:hypothetical protein